MTNIIRKKLVVSASRILLSMSQERKTALIDIANGSVFDAIGTAMWLKEEIVLFPELYSNQDYKQLALDFIDGAINIK